MNAATSASVRFPSVEWFRELAQCMSDQHDEFAKLGDIDCVVAISLVDGGPGGTPWQVCLDFQGIAVRSVRPVGPADLEIVDFVIETDAATWLEMIRNIAENGGRPDLDHTLNRLSLPGTPIRVWSSDPLGRDMFFRFNQTLQRFVNNSALIATHYERE